MSCTVEQDYMPSLRSLRNVESSPAGVREAQKKYSGRRSKIIQAKSCCDDNYDITVSSRSFRIEEQKRDNVERSSSRCLGGLNIPLVAHSTERRNEIFYGCYENLEEIGELRSETQLTAPAVQNGNLPPLRGHVYRTLSLSHQRSRVPLHDHSGDQA